MKGNGNQHPVVLSHPRWELYQGSGLLGRAGPLAIDSQTRDRFHARLRNVILVGAWRVRYFIALTLPVDNLLLKRELVAVH